MCALVLTSATQQFTGGVAKGDSLVDVDGSRLPEGYEYLKVRTYREHRTLFSDTPQVDKILKHLHARALGHEPLAKVGTCSRSLDRKTPGETLQLMVLWKCVPLHDACPRMHILYVHS